MPKENFDMFFRSRFHCFERRQCSERSGIKFGNNCEVRRGIGSNYHSRRGHDLLSTLLLLMNPVIVN